MAARGGRGPGGGGRGYRLKLSQYLIASNRYMYVISLTVELKYSVDDLYLFIQARLGKGCQTSKSTKI